MARVIKFCNAQSYQTGSTYSEIFDVTDISRLDAELRVMSITGTTPSITGTLYTTSDPVFDDNAWQAVGTALSSSVAGTVTGAFSGLGRFVRMKLTVAGTSGLATACLQAVGREP